jgi:hypothetical protein
MIRLIASRPFGVMCLLAVNLTACMRPPEVPPQPTRQGLALESFFSGRSEGEGTFVNSWTGSERRFHVDVHGTWDGATLVLVEDFAYADGQKETKTWRLKATGPGSFTGTREDVVGEARVWTDGAVVRLAYDVELGGWIVSFADVLALQPDGSLLNRANVGKWGIRLGRVELVLRKRDGTS